jgi:hypothetical protein
MGIESIAMLTRVTSSLTVTEPLSSQSPAQLAGSGGVAVEVAIVAEVLVGVGASGVAVSVGVDVGVSGSP